MKRLIVIFLILLFTSGCVTTGPNPIKDIVTIGICLRCGKQHVIVVIPKGHFDEKFKGKHWEYKENLDRLKGE